MLYSDIIRDAVYSSRSQQHNIERWGREDGNKYLKKILFTTVPKPFVQDYTTRIKKNCARIADVLDLDKITEP